MKISTAVWLSLSLAFASTTSVVDAGTLRVDLTDSAITYQPLASHGFLRCLPGRTCHQTLFVFLHGTGESALQYNKIATVMNNADYRVISLAYEAPTTVDSICASQSHSCFNQVRSDRVLGATGSSYVSSVPDGIRNRLYKALVYLHTAMPNEGWSDFYTASTSTLRLDRMIVGGQSQGAGMAAWIGKQWAVQRVCMFGGPWDMYQGAAATWMSTAYTAGVNTPSTEFYGFSHKDDGGTNGINTLSTQWQTLGMGSGSPVAWNASPLQKLTSASTDTDTACVNNPHGCAVHDWDTPVDSGSPRFASAWLYACEP
jgi:hypothetical protein